MLGALVDAIAFGASFLDVLPTTGHLLAETISARYEEFTPPSAPPAWPATFQANFTEVFSGFPAAPSTGAWYYRYEANGPHQWRADHNAPQANNFCKCAKPGVTDTCQLFFEPSALFVHFPSLGACCSLCSAADGCSPLKPDWLSGNQPQRTPGSEMIDGRRCFQYCTPGAVFNDCMSYDENGKPCQYSETSTFSPSFTVVHNLTFTSWSKHISDASVFDLPAQCKEPCPRQFNQCHG
ncbi:hypothetical protein SPRG_17564 [Saprolegnia parasitica CBS 223.65]|uniref:Uncharacterized protein n=1 Tax=Saprolegnia parasitica (strain CBS 223.65) TaxID=695850 RepID=A0A067BJS9_SAPPC|nr:hypothetical protein SPRG_17564 [Saprolegnia parasitica CBS 223.65]KDO16995.1 hypothetical protein SPRG_17564 [Saprolegnia parasitica CBS 223.65]|eukprot:XP_012212297.1 hypothetical protein SPRG_17564 [Saprolegnia parasitica CBS 223.65]